MDRPQQRRTDNNPKLEPAAVTTLSTQVNPPAELCSECDLCGTFH